MTASMEIVNRDQAAAWDGHEGEVWTEHADRYDRASLRIWAHYLEHTPIAATDDVLDVGCGTGRATRDAARLATEGRALGVDLSSRMLECARQRAANEGLTNVDHVQGDAQVFPFAVAAYDVAMSSFGGMFFNDPIAAYSNIARALRPNGRIAMLAWRGLLENRWLVELREALAMGRDLPVPPPEAPTPFSFADPARARTILEGAGFEQVELSPIDEPMDIGTDTDDAYAFAETMGIVEGLTHDLDEPTRQRALTKLREMLAAHETLDGVLLDSASLLITARRP